MKSPVEKSKRRKLSIFASITPMIMSPVGTKRLAWVNEGMRACQPTQAGRVHPMNAAVSSYGIISTMVRPTRVSIILLVSALAAGLAWLKAQQSDPAYSSLPGGTPEEKLWQALILFG